MFQVLTNLDAFTILTFIFVLLLTYIIFYNISNRDLKFPGPRPWPVVGNLPSIIGSKNISKKFLDLQKKYGDIISLKLGKRRLVVVFGYKNVREILVDKGNKTKFRPTGSTISKELFPNGAGIGQSNGQDWVDIRRFSLVALKDFGVGKKTLEMRIHEEVQYLVDLFSKNPKNTVDVSELFPKATSNVISNIIFGARLDYDDPDFGMILENITTLFKVSNISNPGRYFPFINKLFPSSKLAKVIKARRNIQDYIRKRIDKQRHVFDPNDINSFIDLYLAQEGKEDSKVSEHRLFLTIADMYFAGTDTTSVTLQWGMLYLLKYPNVQEKCRNEILEKIGDNRFPEMKDRDQLPYLMATLHEVQRIATIAPIGVPHCAAEDVNFHGKIIPKGTTIIVSLESVHHDPAFWEEPEKFRPERFLSEDGEFIKREAFNPFSLGPRICVGKQLAEMELFLFFTSFIQRFNQLKVDDTDNLCMDGVHTGVTQQLHQFKMRFQPRA